MHSLPIKISRTLFLPYKTEDSRSFLKNRFEVQLTLEKMAKGIKVKSRLMISNENVMTALSRMNLLT